MKWFFALNEESPNFPRYVDMIKVAVATARIHTSLEPVFLYDGNRNGLTDWLEAHGVTVVHRRWRLLDRFHALASAAGKTILIGYAGGVFLRTEIPSLCAEQGWTDERILYTDCDVMFTGDPEHLWPDLHGMFLGMAPESDPKRLDNLNSGVMLMRLPAMRMMDGVFQRFLETNLMEYAITGDQLAYLAFFRHGCRPLAPELNWKPYWGENPEARIVHFHGPKPFLRPVIEGGAGLHVHRRLAQGAYARYCEIWEAALAAAG
jgi:hypothetical protein